MCDDSRGKGTGSRKASTETSASTKPERATSDTESRSVASAANPTEFVTLSEAARRLGVHKKVLYAARDRGELLAYLVGQRWQRVAWADVVAWMRKRPIRAPSKPPKEPSETNPHPGKPLH